MVAAAPPPAAPPIELLSSVVSRTTTAPNGWMTHTVREGETLTGIAAKYRTTVGALVTRNRLDRRAFIHPGQKLSVPRTTAKTSPAKPARTSTPGRTHVVRAGETVSQIAARYGVPVSSVLKANGLSARSLIHPGDRLTVGGTTGTKTSRAAKKTTKAATKTSSRTTVYTVRSGDTLSGIAARHGTSVTAIARANGISTTAYLQVGQRLRLSGPSTSTSAHPVKDTFAGVKYPASVVAAARANHDKLARMKVPSRSEVKRLVAEIARRHGVDPRLALAISYNESGWNQRAVSPANAVGVMQVIPAGGQWASSLVGRKLNLLDTRDNITAGVVMLRALTRATSSTDLAIAAYYQGLSSVKKRGMYADTKRYVATIKRLRSTM